MKSILISIRPKWCELIASGKKTVEVRKTKPKLETSFKVYIYCTKAKEYFSLGGGIYACSDELYRLPTGKIKLGDGFELMADWTGHYDKDNFYNGKVIGEFVCKSVLPISITYSDPNSTVALREFPFTCMTDKEIMDYLGNGNIGYGWCISDLVIYDKPRELSEFRSYNVRAYLENGYPMPTHEIAKPPQSWCYVKESNKED